MLIRKCDNCKKEIKGRDKEIIAGFAWPQFSFCGRCGKPIIAFLKKRKLLQPAKRGPDRSPIAILQQETATDVVSFFFYGLL